MKFRSSWLLGCVFAGCGVLAAAPAGDAALPRLKSAPALDGKIAPAEWQDGRTFQLKKVGGGEVTSPTDVFLGRDDKMLYVGFLCHESDMKNIRKQWTTPEERDNAVWRDDTVEVLLDVWNAGDPDQFRQFIVNPNGVLYDAVGRNARKNFDVRVASWQNADNWSVELAIPLAELAYQPGGTEMWGINLARSNPRTGELSTLTGATDAEFASPAHFRAFRTAPETAVLPFTIRSISTGEVRRVQIAVAPDAPEDLVLTITRSRLDGSAVDQTPAAMVPGADLTVDLRGGKDVARYALTVTRNGRKLYEIDFPAREAGELASTLAHVTRDPLYRELWSDRPMGLGKDGAMFWAHGSLAVEMHPVALQYGFPWSAAGYIADCAAGGLLPIMGNLTRNLDDLRKIGGPAGLKLVYMPDNRWGPAKVPKRGSVPFTFDPEIQQEYYRDLDRMLPYKDQVYAVNFGDEQVNYAIMVLIEFKQKYPDYKMVREFDDAIRNGYGQGKYGLPESEADTNPYRWIATRRYLNDRMIGSIKQLKARLAEIAPAVKVIGDDPMATQNATYDFTDFTPEVCDIMTHQLYPRRNPNISDFGFLTKYVADLIQVDEFWPCMHVEEYSCSFTPEEVVEKISESVRSGATGMHYYLVDTTNRRSGIRYLHSEKYGAPERWQTEMALLKELGQMNRLKFPEADCGFFAPIDTLRSYPGVAASPERAMTIHSILEIHGGVWFKYFNEGSLKKQLVDLGRFKAIFTADAKYLEATALKKIEDYVAAGGVLIITDPEAFSFTPTGDSLADRRRDFLGIAETAAASDVSSFEFGGKNYPVGGTRFVLTPAKDATVAGKYNNGRPAVIENRFGKGKVITFGADLGRLANTDSADYQALIVKLAADQGVKLHQDIWRFRFPLSLIEPAAPISGKCLTGNFVRWERFKPQTGANAAIKDATYRYSVAPDAPAESAAGPDYEPGRGHLTNRIQAIAKGNVDCGKSKLDEWVVGWTKPEAFDITFDFKRPVPVDRVEIIYQGGMRDLTVALADDGENWTETGFTATAEDNRRPDDIRRKELKLKAGSRGRYVRIGFAPGAGKLTLSEVEIWAP